MKKTDKLQYYLTISLTKTDHKEKLIKTNYNFSIKESKHSYKHNQAFKKEHALPMKLDIFQLHPSSTGSTYIYSVFGSVVVVTFQIAFCAEIHINDVFLFFKNHF
jgi:hypothetical protein